MVSLLFFEYQRERQLIDKRGDLDRQSLEKQRELDRKNFEYRDALLLSVLSRAMNAYGQAKKARRILLSRAITIQGDAEEVLANEYDMCFDVLNDAQLELENIARDVQTSAKAFSTPVELAEHLWTMEGYLSELIGEYEIKRRCFSRDRPSLPLRDLSLLKDFLEKTKDSKFKHQIVSPYHEV